MILGLYVFVCVCMGVICGCYMSSVDNNLQIHNFMGICVCCDCGDRRREDYNSWRVTEDGGNKL